MPPKRKQRPGEVRRTVEALRAKKGVVATLYVVLRLAVLVILVAQFLNRNFENVFLCILTLVLFLVPTFIERKIHVDLPDTLEVIILLFIFAAEILGEIQAYYITFPYWDTMLHTLNGFLCAAIGFALVDILNRSERFSITLSPLFLAITAFCFSMTVGVLWEFFECLMDQLFLRQPPHRHSGDHRPDRGHRRRQPARPGPGRVSGYRPFGHHAGPLRQFCRRGDLFHHRLFLCEVSGPGPLCQPLHPQGGAAARDGGRRGRIISPLPRHTKAAGCI